MAKSLAEALDAAIEKIVDLEYRAGVTGHLRSFVETTLGRGSRIASSVHSPAAFDLTVVGGPIWHHAMSSPVRSYLALHRNDFHDVAFFCTGAAPSGNRIFQQMAEICERNPVAVIAVTEDQVARHAHLSLIERFRDRLGGRLVASPL